jgi:hypothetical protein
MKSLLLIEWLCWPTERVAQLSDLDALMQADATKRTKGVQRETELPCLRRCMCTRAY